MAATKIARTAAKAVDLTDYTVRTPIAHDGDHYAVGDTISLSEAQAAQLLAVGAIDAPAAAE